MSADAPHVARAAAVPVGQKPWAEALTRVEVLDVVERNIIRQEKFQKLLNVKSEFELFHQIHHVCPISKVLIFTVE